MQQIYKGPWIVDKPTILVYVIKMVQIFNLFIIKRDINNQPIVITASFQHIIGFITFVFLFVFGGYD